MTFEARVWRYLSAGAHPLHFHHLIHAGGRWNRRGLAPSAALEGDRVLANYPENAPRHLRLLETGVRHPLNYGDRALLDARGELRWPR